MRMVVHRQRDEHLRQQVQRAQLWLLLQWQPDLLLHASAQSKSRFGVRHLLSLDGVDEVTRPFGRFSGVPAVS
jgi:hypothetical protein